MNKSKVQYLHFYITPNGPDDGQDEPTKTEPEYIPYELVSLTIESTHESNDSNWEIDYESGITTYGGVALEVDDDGNKDAEEDSEARTVTEDIEGDFGNMIKSGYAYYQVFEKSDFRFIPRNSISLGKTGSAT